MKIGVALKSLGEKSCEIKGDGHQMVAMMLMLIALTSLQPFDGCNDVKIGADFLRPHLFSQLGCFVQICFTVKDRAIHLFCVLYSIVLVLVECE